MLNIYITIFLLIFAVNLETSEPIKELHLTGFDLAIEDIVTMAKGSIGVVVEPEAWERADQSYQLLLRAAKEGKAVYGLNRGVGLNKDQKIFEGDILTQAAKEASITFNQNNLRATSSAVGPELPSKIVNAIMLVKLNSILQGTTGAQPEVGMLLLEFINRGIQPLIPSRGSVGQADITILSHIGLALMGEGEVYFQGSKIPASEALALNHLKPLVPHAKDSLAIMSSNAYSAALGALLIHDMEEIINKADQIFSLSLEGLNGNIAPFLAEVQNARPYVGQKKSARNIRHALQGSYLWGVSEERALQDPLSFRSVSQVHGTLRDLIASAREKLELHLKSSDDNPITVLNPEEMGSSEQELTYYLNDLSGAVIPTANFETINWIIDFEAVGIALSHLSHASTQRMIRLSSEKFTHLTRFLSPDASTIAFGAIQKAFVALDNEIRSLSLPVSQDSSPIAGEIEDLGTNAPMVMQRLCKIIDNLHYIFGMELMHSAQAIDLRKIANPHLSMGVVTEELYHRYRLQIATIDKDRALTADIQKSHDFLLESWPVIVTPDCVFKENE